MQEWANTTFGIHLEIFDINALAEQLVRTELFWIAQKFLNIPSEMYPRPMDVADSRYTKQREKWIVSKTAPRSFSDFVEIKFGIRHATFTAEAKIDLSDWIGVLKQFFVHGIPDDVVRRSQYEICVAALRGQNDLNTQTDLVITYFSTINLLENTQEIGDAVVLLSYCSSAVLLRHFDFDKEQLHVWTKAMIDRLEFRLKENPGSHTKCELLQYRAHAASLPFQHSGTVETDWAEPFKWWDRLIKEVKNAPLFPLERFANTLTALIPAIGDDPRFLSMTNRVDILLDNRSRGFVAAEKCRDRAIEFMKVNRPLRAIHELHTAKIKWFAEETMKGTILSMLLLSRLYMDLHLVWAAKYYALIASFLIHRHSGDKLKRLLPEAAIELANVYYRGGEWLGFADMLPLIISLQYQYRPDPEDLSRYEDFQSVLFHAMVVKGVSDRFADEELQNYLPNTFIRWPIPLELKELILNVSNPVPNWLSTSDENVIWEKIGDALNAPPFSDAGDIRKYAWRALGIRWEIQCDNTPKTVALVEGLVASLQIIIADIASSELNILPTKVEINATIAPIANYRVKEIEGNDALKWSIELATDGDTEHLQTSATALAAAILISCSLLPDTEILKLFENAFKGGLTQKTFSVRPYGELLREFSSEGVEENHKNYAKLQPPLPEGSLHEADDLAWKTDPGPGYTKAKSLEFVRNRYRRCVPPIRLTLSRLKGTKNFNLFVAKLRAQGYLDWHILLLIANTAINLRMPSEIDPRSKDFSVLRDFMNQEETLDSAQISELELFENDLELRLSVMMLSVAQTWGLNSKSRTPDIQALKKVLVERYGYLEDDIEHENLFD